MPGNWQEPATIPRQAPSQTRAILCVIVEFDLNFLPVLLTGPTCKVSNCVRTVIQLQRGSTQWKQAQSSGSTTPRVLDFLAAKTARTYSSITPRFSPAASARFRKA